MKKSMCVAGVFISLISTAQVKWDGQGDGVSWSDALNWVGDILPLPTDAVLLDNSVMVNNYQVFLPAGAISITVKQLTITPSGGHTITLHNPVTNTSPTAFIATGEGDAVVLNIGAVFKNSSGAVSGTPVSVTTTNFFRINNGGRYVHNCERGHTTTLVARLSSAPGTENGTFQFDVPSASFPISLSGRTYGNLEFSSVSNGGPVTYFSTGSLNATIQGSLFIGQGVQYTLDFTSDVFIHGNLIQSPGSVFNIANGPGNTAIRVRTGIHIAGITTTTGTGSPSIVLQGSIIQPVNITGQLVNAIDFHLNNPAGMNLLADLVLPYRLTISSGNTILGNHHLVTPFIRQIGVPGQNSNHIVTDGSGTLTIKDIDVSTVVFPIGHSIDSYNPVYIGKGQHANYAVRVTQGFPQTIFDPGKAVLRTWSIQSNATLSAEIGFGYATVIGQTGSQFNTASTLDAGILINGWNVFARGIIPLEMSPGNYQVPTTVGSFTANDAYQFVVGNAGSILSNQTSIRSSLHMVEEKVSLRWEVTNASIVDYFSIERAGEDRNFITIASVKVVDSITQYEYIDQWRDKALYRIKIIFRSGLATYSEVHRKIAGYEGLENIRLVPNPVYNNARILLGKNRVGKMLLYDMTGRLIRQIAGISPGTDAIDMNFTGLPRGTYLLKIMTIQPVRTVSIYLLKE